MKVLSEDKNLIIYRKELNKLTGSVTATILLQQMIFHSSNHNYKPFYKFIEPSPANELYREGDSWTEELGFTKYEFRTAYKKLEELKIVSKKTTMTRVTYYTLNKSHLGKLIKSIYVEEIEIEKEPKNAENKDITNVSGESQFTYVDNNDLDYSKIKRQRLPLDDEDEGVITEKLDLTYLDDYVYEVTKNGNNIKSSFTNYRNQIKEVLKDRTHKNHQKTLRNYRTFLNKRIAKESKEVVEEKPIEQLSEIVEIDINNYVGKRINGKYDEGTVERIKTLGIDTYEVVYMGKGIHQSQLLPHTELMTGSQIIKQTKAS
ncbi:hypothetical protein [Sulfurimonas sp.]|uniref:hypothetical protein n=1 Tax=Sulfurimonas sp. TaxID=2022749 RepID=UPI003561DBC0